MKKATKRGWDRKGLGATMWEKHLKGLSKVRQEREDAAISHENYL